LFSLLPAAIYYAADAADLHFELLISLITVFATPTPAFRRRRPPMMPCRYFIFAD